MEKNVGAAQATAARDVGEIVIGRTSRRRRNVSTLVTALIMVVLLTAAGCGTPGGTETRVPEPDTPAGNQLRWLIDSMAQLPLTEEQARTHFNAGYLGVVSPAALGQWLQGLAQWLHAGSGPQLVAVKAGDPSMVAGVVSAGGPRARVGLTVDSHGLIADLDLGPTISGPVPTTWAGVDNALHTVAPQVRLLVADVTDGSCRPVHSIDPDTAAPFGSVVKLYVLAALGNAVAAGTVRWEQVLTVTAPLKSLPSGVLQYEPDGTPISVRDAAAKMIAISDNTATDMLINLVGRSAVEEALSRGGMANPALDRPFLTTRESFILALQQWPTLAQRYLAADEAGRRALLADAVDRLPLPDPAALSALSTRGNAGSLGWLASASDICRVYATLAALAHRPGLSAIGDVLALDDDILELDPAQWASTWRKGGVGPGILAQTFLATTRTGHSYVVTVLAENPTQPLDGNQAAPTLLSAMKGALTLAVRP